MEITQKFAASTAAATAAPGAEPASLIASDFTTFLRMLTVQMQNQDPLDPMSTEQFATQLATFSGVEQQVRSNDLLSRIADQLGFSGLGGFADWVGKEALANMPVRFDGSPVDIRPDIAVGADAARLVVRDAGGNVLRSEALSPDAEALRWPPEGAEGMPPGLVRFDVESYQGGTLLDIRPAQVYAEVQETRLVDGAPALVFAGGATLAPDQVTALRQPGG
ncbi:hypothetical protein DDZ14_09900 [Maritimibacter sp. 55A14]|uniref:flagellar hook capping FlgD N-terminal domain-containing protein n=1 Tax=Maritimibacter sp. 55A14 TaxID=2174844 RepID=UPI000D603DC6|nr:flagellar hook capping FlgD N-terminal domain-containing protein [Maritimibacter sp. 55A14]PWE32374.1 hypothetical protein DDZ14_09900 [Maritimibacter sp. 55A14]